MMSAAALAYLLAALQALPALISAGASVAAEVEALIAFIKAGKDPTPEQWAAQAQAMSTALAGLMNAKPVTFPPTNPQPLA